jgi:TPR repeat protein
MGQTFDPDFLSQFPIEGLKPNIQQARKWYKQATELGSPEARARLATLGGAQ